MRKLLLLLFFLCLAASQQENCTLDNCDWCDMTESPPTACVTCHGWYESSWDTSLCVLSARLIILCIASGVLVICVTICAVVKIQEYRAKYTERPANIESLESRRNRAVSEEEVSALEWQSAKEKINDVSKCNICNANGGTVRLRCGHVFHGDCICWQLRKQARCPACGSGDTQSCTVHCLKCLTNYLECPPEMYVDIKMRRSRVCDQCSKKE